jgi:sialic acid synthase SpsE
MWGTDQAASVEVQGFARLIRTIREVEQALGDGVKRVHEGEIALRTKLRRVASEVEVPAGVNGSATNGAPNGSNGAYVNGS